MSRKSRYAEKDDRFPAVAPWRAGAYIRLSKEDEGNSSVSQSVLSQKEIIDGFVSTHGDIRVIEYFTDDGYSGTDMDRPGFQRLKAAFERGEINCILIKDLSRLARNDEEAGRYVYVIFPFYKIRFISVNDKVDSFADPSSVYGLEIPFKNIMHAEYSKDLSKKIISACDIRRRRGEFVGAFCPYGYRKDPDDKHRLQIDDEAAAVVRFIYRRYLSVGSIRKVAKELSERNIYTPLAYKRSKGCRLQVPKKQQNETIWKDGTVRKILTDETYTGTLIQRKQKKLSYKSKRRIFADAFDRSRTDNAQEAIVSAELFRAVQETLCKNGRKNAKPSRENVLAGTVYCGACGAAMAYGRSGRYAYYHCKTAYLKTDACTPKRIRADKLEKVVVDTLNSDLKLCMNAAEVAESMEKAARRARNAEDAVFAQKEAQRRAEQTKKIELYRRYKEGELTREQYVQERAAAEKRIAAWDAEASATAYSAAKEFDYKKYPLFCEFSAYGAFTKLTQECVRKFVQKITVYGPTEIEVCFTFSDAFSAWQEYVQNHAS